MCNYGPPKRRHGSKVLEGWLEISAISVPLPTSIGSSRYRAFSASTIPTLSTTPLEINLRTTPLIRRRARDYHKDMRFALHVEYAHIFLNFGFTTRITATE